MPSPGRPIPTDRLELVSMSPRFIEALLEGRPDEAQRIGKLQIPDDWPTPHDRRFLGSRLTRMRNNPELQPWFVYAIVLRTERPMIGHVGFLGPPGTNTLGRPGAVEVGYTIFEPYRGRGYATEAAGAIVRWAVDTGAVSDVIATVAVDNRPSRAVLTKLGFVEARRRWDDEEGEQLEFELRLSDVA